MFLVIYIYTFVLTILLFYIMKHGIVRSCVISNSNSYQLKDNLYGLPPIRVTREILASYAKFKKLKLSNYKKLPKSLLFRLNQICPNCFFLQCSCIKIHNYCNNCQIYFKPQTDQFLKILQKVLKVKIISQCKMCKNKMERILINFKNSYKGKLRLFKNNLNNILDNFRFRIQVNQHTYPPSFLWNTNTILCELIQKLLHNNKPYDSKQKLQVNIKPDPSSFIGQGKNNCFRKILLSKKSHFSARSVVIPAPNCKTNEIILNKKIWACMNYPKYVLAIRYPVLDTRAFTFHKVKHFWDAPVVGLPTSITEKNNVDFDGDTLNIYAINSCMSISECFFLINPEFSFVAMGEIRPNLTHEQLEMMYNFFKIKKQNLYNWLYIKYLLNNSYTALTVFENLRHGLVKLSSVVKPTFTYLEFYNILKIFLLQSYDEDNFIIEWGKNKTTCNSLFNHYMISNSNRFNKRHLHLTVKCLRGLNKIEYLQESFSSRSILSKSGVEIMGYSTHKLSYVLPELFYNNGNVYYGLDIIAYENFRRLYTTIYTFDTLRRFAIYNLIRSYF